MRNPNNTPGQMELLEILILNFREILTNRWLINEGLDNIKKTTKLNT